MFNLHCLSPSPLPIPFALVFPFSLTYDHLYKTCPLWYTFHPCDPLQMHVDWCILLPKVWHIVRWSHCWFGSVTLKETTTGPSRIWHSALSECELWIHDSWIAYCLGYLSLVWRHIISINVNKWMTKVLFIRRLAPFSLVDMQSVHKLIPHH